MITSENEFYVNAYADWSHKSEETNPEWVWIETLNYNKKTGETAKLSLGEFGSNFRYGVCTD